MLFPISSVVVFGLIALVVLRGETRSGLLVVLGAWALSLAMTAAPVLTYRVDYSRVTDVFVACTLAALTASYLLVRRPSLPVSPSAPPPSISISLSRVVAFVGLLGNLLLLADAARRGISFSLGSFGENLESRRDQAFDSAAAGEASALALVGNLLAPASFLYLILSIRAKRGDRYTMALALMSFFLITMVALFGQAGRQPIFVAVMFLLVAAWLGGRRLITPSPRTAIVAVLAVASGLYFATGFVAARTGGVNPERLADHGHRAEFPGWIAPTASQRPALGLGLFQFSYFSSAIPTLAFYESQDPIPGPFYGAYSFPLPTKVLAIATGSYTDGMWLQTRLEMQLPLAGQGYHPNVWGTWLRDLLVDFGYIGAVFFCGLFGLLMGWARNRHERTGLLGYHSLDVVLVGTAAFGAFQSLLYVNFGGFTLYMTLVLILAERFLPRATPERVVRRQPWSVDNGDRAGVSGPADALAR